MNPSLKAVVFDLDGVITDTAEHHYLAWKAIGDELGLPFTRSFNENLKGVSRMESLRLLLSLSKEPLRFTEEQLEALATRKNELYKRLIMEITPQDALPGIPELLDELKRRGVKTAIASASKNAFTVIDNLRMNDRFDCIVDAAQIRNSKPDPEVFLKAAELLGVEPEACVGVEDAVAGVEAIRAANMASIAIGDAAAFPEADLVLPSTGELTVERVREAWERKRKA
ncbi:beta-phosphoglucomutase [Paenibacillus antri]|uniref:Beta-phosphoglucomutase n=1 Tax=Paenibacillus antri TaxID=2582848 RepID=A0A5R9FYI8_9BACL|nr:beta-phosphoglucomutase [Paenibacillus antri]TLS49112.1 beta-phosphoglucomutase [Paenibacillus antri]